MANNPQEGEVPVERVRSAQQQSQPQQTQPTRQQGRRELERRQPSSHMQQRGYMTSPYSLMQRMMEDMQRLFEGSGFSPLGRSFFDTGLSGMQMFNPQVELFTRGDELVVCADLPGVDKKDIRLEVTDDGLLIEGERKNEREEKREGYYHSERSYGSFQRLVPLPEGINPDTARAEMKDGVLEVCFKVPENRRARKIEIAEGTPGTKKSMH